MVFFKNLINASIVIFALSIFVLMIAVCFTIGFKLLSIIGAIIGTIVGLIVGMAIFATMLEKMWA